MPKYHSLVALCSALILAGCNGGNGGGAPSSSAPGVSSAQGSSLSSSSASSSSSSVASVAPSESIKLNQVGFLTQAPKIALVAETSAGTFDLVDMQGNVVFSGPLSSAAEWAPADERVHQADFSEWQTPGQYRVVADGASSGVFNIGADAFNDVHQAALKAYYFNRASTALDEAYAGPWARPAGHPDDAVLVHASAATSDRPEGTVLSAPKGWYDAGDYNKYIVNSGISTYTLMAAYEHFPGLYQDFQVNIPPSEHDLPDLLEEILWNIDWMEQMQDLDGGVYHKLTTANFAGRVMPHQATATRYVVQKNTAATLNFAAVMAQASRVYAPYLPERAQQFEQAALNAWAWAEANPSITYQQPTGIRTGAYAPVGETLQDEFAWAAAELFLMTDDDAYLDDFFSRNELPGVPWWGGVAALGYISLAHHADRLPEPQLNDIRQALQTTANDLLSTQQSSAFGVAMLSPNFNWGSNSEVLNRGLMMLQAYRMTGNQDFLDAALAHVDYTLGRNATNYSFVTGHGWHPPMHIHHRQSDADDVEQPVPGFLAGGPHSGQQDDCTYPSNLPAKSFFDGWCSYSTNEVTINWNAPLVYMLGAVSYYYQD